MDNASVKHFIFDKLTRKTSIEEIKDSELKEQEVLLKKISDLSSKKGPRQKKSKKQKDFETQLMKRKNSWTQKWDEFFGFFEDGDEIWEFCSPLEDWEQLMGSEGYVLIKENQVKKILILRMN